jgi:hypothetical protein
MLRPVKLVFERILMISFAKNIQVYFQCTHSTDFKCINLRVINGSYKCIRREMSYWKMTQDLVQQEQSQDFDLRRKEKAVVGRIRLGALSRCLYTQRQEEMTCQPAPQCLFRPFTSLPAPLYQEIALNCKAPHSVATCAAYTSSNIKLDVLEVTV